MLSVDRRAQKRKKAFCKKNGLENSDYDEPHENNKRDKDVSGDYNDNQCGFDAKVNDDGGNDYGYGDGCNYDDDITEVSQQKVMDAKKHELNATALSNGSNSVIKFKDENTKHSKPLENSKNRFEKEESGDGFTESKRWAILIA